MQNTFYVLTPIPAEGPSYPSLAGALDPPGAGKANPGRMNQRSPADCSPFSPLIYDKISYRYNDTNIIAENQIERQRAQRHPDRMVIDARLNE
jgi:hypothetical protein